MNQQTSIPAIQTFELTKTYRQGKPPALDRLSLTVNRGEIFGYLGPNGAGKTTTIRCFLDIIRPTIGSATLLGMDAQKNAVELHRQIGFLPGELNLWDNLTGRQTINYLGRLRGNLDWSYVEQLARRLDFDISKRVRSYSSGNRRKLGIILALMHRPELLILDEPTNGLDPLMQQIFHELMREVRNEGRTVFLSSHILSEVQAICDRVGILRDGQLKAVERVSDLVRVNFQWITLQFNTPVSPDRVTTLPGITDVSVEHNALKFRYVGDIDPVLRAVSDQYIVNIRTQEPSLEEIFLTYYGNGSVLKQEPIKEVVR
jgi:ABC-2 type transport system ATP-binding protein